MEEEELEGDVAVRGSNWSVAAYFIMVVCGLAFAVFAAHHLVEQARLIAIELNVPHAIVGTTVSGIGTSLPELTIALMAAKRSQGVAIGTLIGSNITDPLLSIGLAGFPSVNSTITIVDRNIKKTVVAVIITSCLLSPTSLVFYPYDLFSFRLVRLYIQHNTLHHQ